MEAVTVEAANRKGAVRIKKTNDRNRYILGGGIWVRDFTNNNVPFVNINKMIDKEDYKVVLSNEMKNKTLRRGSISEEVFNFPKIVIVSDGYGFAEKHKMLFNLGSDVIIIAVNGALAKWELMQGEVRKPINLYVANNPYEECKSYLPKKSNYYPSCASSIRTNPDFINKYLGNIYFYYPSQDAGFGQSNIERYCIDDYRNPVCAAIGLAYRFGVQKLMLLCCDDSFKDERPAAEKLPNGLWTYPQQIKSHDIIDANLYWLTHQEDKEVVVADHSSGPEYNHAQYISNEEAMSAFFEDTILSGV